MLAWLTPDDQPGAPVAGLIWLPAGEDYEALPIGAYAELLFESNYEQSGVMTPEETADAFAEPGYHTARRWRQVWDAYTQKILSYHDQNLFTYWPLWEALAATRARDLAPSAFHGTLSYGTWESTGIGDGRTSVDMVGTNSRIDVYSSTLANHFPYDAGLIAGWFESDDWTVVTNRFLWNFYNGTDYYFRLRHLNQQLNFQLKSPGVAQANVVWDIPDGWSGFHHIGCSWSVAEDRFRLHVDGVEVGSQNHPGDWGGSQITAALLGSALPSSVNAFDGRMAHIGIWSIEKPDNEIAHLAISTN